MNCGIDFGTSNSTLAVAKEGNVELATIEDARGTLPSAVFYPFEGEPVFGRKAMRNFVDGEEGRFMRSLKRILGTSLMPHGTLVNGKNKKFESILGDFIGHMKNQAEAQFCQSIENVVMGRPVHFVDGDTAADLRAQAELERIAQNVGFGNIEFQYEPIAAAFAHERKLTGEKLALVVDIGGGTSDFTIIRLSKDKMDKVERKDDILANSGTRVGGNDFDKDLCLAVFMPPLGYQTTYGEKNMPLPVSPFFDMAEWSKINFLYTPKVRGMIGNLYHQSNDKEKFGRFVKIIKEETGHQLLAAVEDSKIRLTDLPFTEASLDFVEGGLKINVALGAFNMAVDKHVAAISRSVTECLQQAGLAEDSIELIVLTGGTTEVPILKEEIGKRFPQAEVSEENKLSSVGLGLGYDSLRRFGEPFSARTRGRSR